MDEKECNVCKKFIKEKYKHYNTWKAIAIIFMCLTVLFAILYFTNSDIMTSTIVEYDNNVVIEKKNDNTEDVILLSSVIFAGGIICDSYIVSKKEIKA